MKLSTMVTKAPSRTTPCTTRKSRETIDWTVSSPSPGQAKTVSTITAPARSCDISSAATEITGIEAFRSRWRQHQPERRDAPRAGGAHVVLRELVEDCGARDAGEGRHAESPSANDGMIRCSTPPAPEGGSQPSHTAKNRINRMPLQKVGILCEARTKPDQDPCLNSVSPERHNDAERHAEPEGDEERPPASRRV